MSTPRELPPSAHHERFLGLLAHELRSPLSVVSMALGSLPASSSMRSLGEAALADVDALLERVSIASRLDRGVVTLALDDVALADVTADALRRPDLLRRGAQARVDVRIEVPTWRADAWLLRAVLRELIDNALRYGSDRAPVEVVLAVDGDAGELVLRVRNALDRAAPVDPERAFERYHRGERAAAITGAGLGLYVVGGLARCSGGRASMRTDDQDVVVEVRLP